jgi:hypothetical protein
MFKYIIILKDGSFYGINKDLTTDDFDSWCTGLFDIIRTSDQKVYNNGKWEPLKDMTKLGLGD